MTDLQATLIVVRDENNALRDSRIPAARLAYNTLPDTIDKLQKRVNQLVDFAHANLLKHGKGLSRLGLSERRRKQLVEIRDGISEAHSNLRLVLLTANLSVPLRFIPSIYETKVNEFIVAVAKSCCRQSKRRLWCKMRIILRLPQN